MISAMYTDEQLSWLIQFMVMDTDWGLQMRGFMDYTGYMDQKILSIIMSVCERVEIIVQRVCFAATSVFHHAGLDIILLDTNF